VVTMDQAEFISDARAYARARFAQMPKRHRCSSLRTGDTGSNADRSYPGPGGSTYRKDGSGR